MQTQYIKAPFYANCLLTPLVLGLFNHDSHVMAMFTIFRRHTDFSSLIKYAIRWPTPKSYSLKLHMKTILHFTCSLKSMIRLKETIEKIIDISIKNCSSPILCFVLWCKPNLNKHILKYVKKCTYVE